MLEVISMANIDKIMLSSMMPYAKGTIIDRAIPYVDGFKPVVRRIMYSMYELKLWDKKAKCHRIVGDTMGKYHPHGDSSIYDALVRLADSNGTLNAPLISGQGNFGKSWSDEITPAHMRYTEAGLAPIARELFDGLNENAVDMVDNFDGTEKEPAMLPVKFPNVLVNTSSGIAVGMGSYIPPYNLKDVCLATIDILTGKATKPMDLLDVLGAPDFSSGGFIHVSKADLLGLLKKGTGTLTMTGQVQLFKDAIVINSLPYNTTITKVVAQIEAQCTKDGPLKDISGVTESTGLSGMKCKINVKRSADVRDVLRKLYRYTDLRKKISFTTRIIHDNQPKEMGVYELLETWIEFRVDTIKRVKRYQLDKAIAREHLLRAWELVGANIANVAIMISKNTEAVAKDNLIKVYGMDEEQADYLLDMKVRQITVDNMKKRLVELSNIRTEIDNIGKFLNDEVAIRNCIAGELKEIVKKYGHDRVTKVLDPVVEIEGEDADKEVIPDMDVWVLVTEKGYIKKLLNPMDCFKADNWLSEGDSVLKEIKCRNTENILVVTYGGFCYKIPVNSIESSKSAFKNYIWDLADKKDDYDVLYITNSGDYNKYFNVVYNNGKGRKIWLGAVSGPRMKYKSLFEPGNKKTMFLAEADEFFIITYKKKAAYANLKILNRYSSRSAFKIARVGSDDAVFGIQPVENVPDMSTIDLDRYTKGYTVSIRNDALWKRKNLQVKEVETEQDVKAEE